MHVENSIQLLLFPLQHNFATVQLSHCLFLSPLCHQNTLILKRNLLITQIPDAELRESTTTDWAVPWAIPTLPTALAGCFQCALSSVSCRISDFSTSAVRIEFGRVQDVWNWNSVRQGTIRLKLALKSLIYKSLFFCSYVCSSYFFIIIILINKPRILSTCYVALENSKTFPQKMKFSDKIWKDPQKFRLRGKSTSGNLTFS